MNVRKLIYQIILLGLFSCSSYAPLRTPAGIVHNKSCYSTVSQFFTSKIKVSEADYEEMLSKRLAKIAEPDKAQASLNEELLGQAGYPQNVAKRIAQQYPDDAKKIILSDKGSNAFFKAYRGMKMDHQYATLRRLPITRGGYGGDYYTEVERIARDYAANKQFAQEGIVIESYIPQIFTHKGVQNIRKSFVMTHDDAVLFIHRIAFVTKDGKQGPWILLEEAIEKGLLSIRD